MKSLWLEQEFKYDGTQLRSLFGYLDHKVLGDSVVAWVGPCEVTLDHMVDGEDRLMGAEICGDKMLHFIIEKFHCSLLAGVSLQRLFTCIAKETLYEISKDKNQISSLVRDGDDLYLEDQKLNISIATLSPMSSLIHWAINVVNEGTPVKTLCLQDLGVDPKEFAGLLMNKFCSEVNSIDQATQKVMWVK